MLFPLVAFLTGLVFTCFSNGIIVSIRAKYVLSETVILNKIGLHFNAGRYYNSAEQIGE